MTHDDQVQVGGISKAHWMRLRMDILLTYDNYMVTTTRVCLILSMLLLVNETLIHNSFGVFISQYRIISEIQLYCIIRTFDAFSSAFKYADVRVHGTFASQLVLCQIPRARGKTDKLVN